MQIQVLDRQTIWDIALQGYGDVAGVFLLFADNPSMGDFDLNYNLTTGQFLNITSPPINQDNVNYYQQNGFTPVTGPTLDGTEFNGDYNDDFSNDFFIFHE